MQSSVPTAAHGTRYIAPAPPTDSATSSPTSSTRSPRLRDFDEGEILLGTVALSGAVFGARGPNVAAVAVTGVPGAAANGRVPTARPRGADPREPGHQLS